MHLPDRFKWLLILGCGALVAAAIVLLQPKPTPRPAPEPPLVRVPVVEAAAQTQALAVYSQGTLTPLREIDLVAEVAGRVQSVADNFVAGAFFEAGEALVQIDPANYQLATIRAKARVAEAEQLLATEKGRARQARREWRDLGNAEANALFLREPQLKAAEAGVAAAQADLRQAELDLAKTAIGAPFAGRIRDIHVNRGQYVAPGSKLARVFDSEVVEVRLPLTDGQIALLDLPLGYRAAPGEGTPVVVRGTVAGELREWRGRVSRTEASLDTQTRMYHAVAEIRKQDNPDKPLVVGLFVRAEIAGRAIENVVQIPRTALYKDRQVVLVDATNQVRVVRADVLKSNAQFAWVRLPLEAGDRVATGRQGYLKPGARVEPVVEDVPELPVPAAAAEGEA
ncbi:efflux RND transporter periplasmic adaptor subunit [Simiduia sp. 21SJ11W-1]|uniref:efflux RND transporter periplasmic adaptor subunit n=1 Tax=Simiduia sp. 21SJ11W-1 TaxID=2909669 RepID=UPI00209D28C5|nr:efflux RND transporter periplasmic adaptor subunit [Simiduia sp. 21SJ11W-1]UTA48072.1 efflux RND transporter periplasmic adaptor subunit [Simiduia sp. 21SJ11W-1]